jgi:hypothetical protein
LALPLTAEGQRTIAAMNRPPAKRTRQPSPITQPGYMKGRKAPNRGRKLPTPILSRHEVQTLFASFHPSRVADVRDKALLWLAYRHGVKMVQLLALDVSDYDHTRERLRIAARSKLPAREIELDAVGRGLLRDWMAMRRQLGIPPFALLFCAATAGPSGRPLGASHIRSKLAHKGNVLQLHSRVTLEGLRASGKRHPHAEDLGVGAQVFARVDSEGFPTRYEAAYAKWADADALFQLDPVRHATRIGHDCREALDLFAEQLLRLHGLPMTKGSGTVDKLRTVAAAVVPSDTVREFLDALILYWRRVSDLSQRQEHGAKLERERLTAEDARRVVFHSILVMYEVDAALAATAAL